MPDPRCPGNPRQGPGVSKVLFFVSTCAKMGRDENKRKARAAAAPRFSVCSSACVVFLRPPARFLLEAQSSELQARRLLHQIDLPGLWCPKAI